MSLPEQLKPITYSLRIWGDFQIGSGVGLPGVLDERVIHDQDNFAYVPGSEIKGLIRESCRQLIEARHRGELMCLGQRKHFAGEAGKQVMATEFCQNSADSICLICALFGSPFRQSPLWFSPAEYDENYRNLLKKAELVERDRNTRAQASINHWTRRAQAHHLFSAEVVSPNENFFGQIEFAEPISPVFKNENPLVWLTAALLFTRRIGGGRRRGRGRCEFKLMQGTDDNANLVAQQALTNWLGGSHERS